MRSIVALGREFRFPLDTELLPTPTLNSDDSQGLFMYLQYLSTNYQFTILLLKILLEENITAHRGLWNKGKKQQIFKIGDFIRAHIKVQAKLETG